MAIQLYIESPLAWQVVSHLSSKYALPLICKQTASPVEAVVCLRRSYREQVWKRGGEAKVPSAQNILSHERGVPALCYMYIDRLAVKYTHMQTPCT